MRRVRNAGEVRRVTGVPRREVGVVHGNDDGPVVLRHGGDGLAIVRVRQVFLGVLVGAEDQGFAVTIATAVTPADAVLTSPAGAADIKRGAGQAQAGLEQGGNRAVMGRSGPAQKGLRTDTHALGSGFLGRIAVF